MDRKSSPKKAVSEDWERAYIGYRLKKAGWTFSKLAKHHGYSSRSTLQYAIDKRWPKGERLIAEAIGIPPETIWPSRYECTPAVSACNAKKGGMSA